LMTDTPNTHAPRELSHDTHATPHHTTAVPPAMLRSFATATLLAFGAAQDNVVDEVRAAKSNCLITRRGHRAQPRLPGSASFAWLNLLTTLRCRRC
jgi:hypothetical protein